VPAVIAEDEAAEWFRMICPAVVTLIVPPVVESETVGLAVSVLVRSIMRAA